MLASLIASIATGEMIDAVRRARVAVVVYLIAGLALLCGVGFLFAAAFIAVSSRFGSLYASLGFGAGFLILAVLTLGIHKVASRARAKRAAELRAERMKAYAGAAALGLLPALLKSKSGAASLIGSVLAIAAYAIWKENAADAEKGQDRKPL